MVSEIQVLIHEGELWQIAEAIRGSKATDSPVKGCLFGLWRNSLKQPVVQFVTGPSKKSKKYEENCQEIMMKDHAMLLLGYWYSGHINEEVIREEFQNPKCNVLLFLDVNPNQITGYFAVNKDGQRTEGNICQEDVLPEESSFRLSKKLADKTGTNYVIRKLKDADNEGERFKSLVKKLPLRAEMRVAQTKKEQWYSEDDGMGLLQAITQYFKDKGLTLDMSRDANTHNLQFTINDRYRVDFPIDFPYGNPIFTELSGRQGPIRLCIQADRHDLIPEALYQAFCRGARY